MRERNMNKVSPSVETVRPVEAVTAVTAAKIAPLKQKTVFKHEDRVTTCSFSPEGLLAVATVYPVLSGAISKLRHRKHNRSRGPLEDIPYLWYPSARSALRQVEFILVVY